MPTNDKNEAFNVISLAIFQTAAEKIPAALRCKRGICMAKILKAQEMSKCIGCFSCMNICAAVNHQNHSMMKSSIRIKTSGGLSGRFVAVVCLGCEEPACAEGCPTGALTVREGGGVKLKKETCIGCGRCEEACIAGAAALDKDTNKPIICHHCGTCVKFCPHGCLTMEEI